MNRAWRLLTTALLAGVVTAGVAEAQNAAVRPTASAGRGSGQVVAGRVVSAVDGHPIPHATLVLSGPQRDRRQQGPATGSTLTVQTDAEGRYSFAPQAAGEYALRASASGYLPALYLEHEGFSSAVVLGTGVLADRLDFPLLPNASIRGRVVDDTGEPVRGNVTLYRDFENDHGPGATVDGSGSRVRPAGGSACDDDGRFEFSNLQPGRYYVAVAATPWYAVHPRHVESEERLPYRSSVDPALDVTYPLTFYPNATTEDGATPILLRPGQRFTANLLLQSEPALTLTVQMPPAESGSGEGVRSFPMLVRKVFGGDQPAMSQVAGRAGQTVVMSGLAPGQYMLRAYGPPGQPRPEETPVTISGGATAVRMNVAEARGDLAIAVHASGGEAPTADDLQVELPRVEAGRDAEPVLARVESGTAHFHGLAAGSYRIRLRGGGKTWSVTRLTVNGKAEPSRVLRVSGPTTQAELSAAPYSPEVDGVVHGADGKAHAGSMVVLVPAGVDSSADLFRADQSNLDGGFQFYNVVPGNYLLVAIEDGWKLDWQSAQNLMPYLAHAVPLTVAASGPRVVPLAEAVLVQQR